MERAPLGLSLRMPPQAGTPAGRHLLPLKPGVPTRAPWRGPASSGWGPSPPDCCCGSVQVLKLLQTAKAHRAIAKTSLNERSSRSHSLFQLRLEGHNASRDLHTAGEGGGS